MYKELLEIAIRELEFCIGTSPLCDRQRIEKTLKTIKKRLTQPKKQAKLKTGKNIHERKRR